jgi:hypothetical protein
LRQFVGEVQSRNAFYKADELRKLYAAGEWTDFEHVYKEYLVMPDR